MKFQPPKGTRDLLPEDANKLHKIIEICRTVFEKYGFEPLITPAFESFELLSAKGGLGEAVKDEIYYFKDKSDRELGLRFDLTMPLARVVSSTSLPKPFKRYAIDKVWRYDNPAFLRFREFWQADIDVIGSNNMLSDVECVSAVCEILDSLGFKNYFIRVNSRKLLQNEFERIVKKDELIEVFRTIDKLDKIGLEGVEEELKKKNLEPKNILKILKTENLKDVPDNEGKKELIEFFSLAKKLGIDKKLKFDISLVRGLEYYTSVVFEVNLGAKVSCGGGGRYDNLIKNIGGQDLPATGISLGLDRILEVMKENKMSKTEKTNTKVFVANVDNNVIDDAVKIVQQLRKNGINSQMDLMGRSFGKQLEYASNSQIPYVVIVGRDEAKKKTFKLKDMKTGKQRNLALKNIISQLLKMEKTNVTKDILGSLKGWKINTQKALDKLDREEDG
ncbi:MAG: histidine--tRNA ligase [Candidatus Aenigmarchaeota archaeon]|nr:histidine--tRNA ligase [Candidatus Aenigmarchaeota archaeon]